MWHAAWASKRQPAPFRLSPKCSGPLSTDRDGSQRNLGAPMQRAHPPPVLRMTGTNGTTRRQRCLVRLLVVAMVKGADVVDFAGVVEVVLNHRVDQPAR